MTPATSATSRAPWTKGTCVACGKRFTVTAAGTFPVRHIRKGKTCGGYRMLCMESTH